MIRDFMSKLMARLAAMPALLKCIAMLCLALVGLCIAVAVCIISLTATIGGVAGLVWLAVLGEWKIIFIGLFSVGLGQIIISFLFAPGMGILFLIAYFARNFPSMNALTFADNKVKYIALVGAIAPVYVLAEFLFAAGLALWGIGVLYFFLALTSDVAAYIPTVIWAYAVAGGAVLRFCYRATELNKADPPIKDDGKIFTVSLAFGVSYTMGIFTLLWHGAPVSMPLLQLIAVAMTIIIMVSGVIRAVVYAWINRRQSPPR